MLTKSLTKGAVCVLVWALLANCPGSSCVATNSSTEGHSYRSAEKALLDALGLKEGVDDNEIIKILDVRDKRILATALIRYRKIFSATPKLLQIVNDNRTTIFAKLAAAEALCDFGNREWVKPIKVLSTDPNSCLDTPLKVEIAGLLARAGDYSQFEVVASHIRDSKQSVRYVAIKTLGNFRHKTETVTDLAVGLLMSVATSDPVPRLREEAIYSLQKIDEKKPVITVKIIDALKANIDSSDKNLRIVCRALLKHYTKKLRKD